MRYIITMFWAMALGQVVGYLGGALNQQSYDFKTTLIVSIIAGLLIIAIGTLAFPSKKKTEAPEAESK